MGVSLKSVSKRFSTDIFSPWDAVNDRFLVSKSDQFKGRLFRVDRFTTIYHRPTRRAFIAWVEDLPASGVIRREGTEEVFLVSETMKSEVLDGRYVYDRLRQSHLATPPSGGSGAFYPVTTTGTGDDLGPISMSVAVPVYVDTELQGVASAEDTEDVSVSRFLINHSLNVSPQPGDYFKWSNRWFLVNTPYIDGGLRVVRASELVPAYETMTYLKHTGASPGYSPVTGVVSPVTVSRQFSALIGLNQLTGPTTEFKSTRSMVLYVYVRHIGFDPQLGDAIQHQGVTYQIDRVTMRRDELQWKLEVSR